MNDPRDFEKNNVLYRYPIDGDRLKIGRFCSIACGAKFLFTSGNHTLRSLSTYTFPIFFDEWNLDKSRICEAWDNKGDIELGNDVWVGYEAVIMSGVKIGSGADRRYACRGHEGCAAVHRCCGCSRKADSQKVRRFND